MSDITQLTSPLLSNRPAISIINGHVIDPANQVDKKVNIHLQHGKIVALGDAPENFVAQRVIDASEQIICPGLIDLRFHLRESGYETKGSIASETKAAAAGGVTALCCPPDTDPIIDNPAMVKLIRLKAETEGAAKIYTLSALTQQLKGEKLSEMRKLKDAGCVGTSNALHPVKSTLVMRRALEYAASHDITVFIQAFDPWLSDGCAHEGAVSTRLGLAGIPISAETIAIARDLQLIELTGAKAHFCQLSSAKAVQLIHQAQEDGLPVTADVTAHHLHLTEMDIGYFDSNCHVIPPLRTQRDQDALRRGLKSGVISNIVSDHQPHGSDAKLAPFAETEAGISGVETLLPLALKMIDDQVMPLSDVIARLTSQPAETLGLKEGTLSIGSDADICIFDPEAYWVVDREKFLSQGQNTPFHSWELKGKVNYTFKSGEMVFSSQ
ncbi:MAG: dihydroorotase [gamma proteobacterium symbiont of Bathyaustriella thionipta]|nr:dihydroorotase [gamma proteobacterium symbiont of Bathyaustriella thionipta]MCU7949902.1 dihydroorotase [gamma proteobacterium symbiont of Bathyaustriella thionipta]MCU7954064.1 dihydroorotase [gamma proteobacterium symbiont of Bathyaustriella thionipta]MCU7956499.1 dihydroorotase [gamma proteobacterium symbiont of Bathyaustriella thionipta]MCU7968559.1 dihydroorotase [gamma proteobacterium symbiont of Bathyaustriella thionipta]